MKRMAKFTYKNHKNVISERTVCVDGVFFGTTDFHKEPQWILEGYDYDREADREYAMKDISHWFDKQIEISSNMNLDDGKE